MHLDFMANLQREKSLQSDLRQNKAQEAIQRATTFFQEAYNTGFKQRDKVLKASNAFIEAIKYNRRDPHPYVAMGYLLLVFDDRQQALGYLKTALELDPHQPDAQNLLKIAVQPAEKSKPKQTIPVANFTSAIDYDALYDQCETWVRQHTFQAMSIQLPAGATVEPTVIEQLKQQYQTLQDAYQLIVEHVRVIDEEIDTGELTRQLRPLETRLKQLAKLYQECQTFVRIHTEIRELTNQVETRLKHENTRELFLESILDHCDTLADQLDNLSQKGVAIAELEQVYNHLVEQVGLLQEMLDDTGH